MNTRIILLGLFLVLLGAESAQAAIYVKFDGVDGESSAEASSTMQITARTATTSEAKGNVEYGWKVEEGESATEDKSSPKILEANTKGQANDPDRPLIEGRVGNSENAESGEKGGTEDINIGVGEMQSGQNNQTDLDFLKGNAVSASAVEVRGWDAKQKQEFLATVKAHAEVQSGQDLENFARGVLLEDENVEQISLNFEKIKINYRGNGKLFGFVPFSFTEEVTVDTQASSSERVKVKFPWFTFLMSIDLSAADIETELEGEFGTGNEKWFKDNSGASEIAKAFTTLSNILKTKHDTVKNSIGNVR